MTKVVFTSDIMREAESRYMLEYGVTELELVSRAARHVASRLSAIAPKGLVAFACGAGGNGADGFEAARLYAQEGGRSLVILACDEGKLSPDARACYEQALSTSGVEVTSDLGVNPDCWVDAMFGIGLKRPLRDLPLEILRAINSDRGQGTPVLSVDIPSGLSADSGLALGECVRATHTVTFECEKPGHLLGIGPDVCREVYIGSIGIPERFYCGRAILHPNLQDARHALKPRARLSHKGTFGHVLIIAGCFGMAGAGVMSAMAALRSGAGLVTVACPTSIVPALQIAEPSAMCLPLPERGGVISIEALPIVAEALKNKTAVVIGPGLTTQAPVEIIRLVLASGLPTVIDADALNIISLNDDLKNMLAPHHVITPHPGEAARLLGETVADALACAKSLRDMGPVVVLKGAASIIIGERTYISTTGCAGLAKGGSGDVLSGMLGALLAQGYAPADAAWIADTFHGALGEITARAYGQIAMTSRDLISQMRYVWGDGSV